MSKEVTVVTPAAQMSRPASWDSLSHASGQSQPQPQRQRSRWPQAEGTLGPSASPWAHAPGGFGSYAKSGDSPSTFLGPHVSRDSRGVDWNLGGFRSHCLWPESQTSGTPEGWCRGCHADLLVTWWRLGCGLGSEDSFRLKRERKAFLPPRGCPLAKVTEPLCVGLSGPFFSSDHSSPVVSWFARAAMKNTSDWGS